MKRLYFCRHGLSQLNQEARWAGSTETPLVAIGREQSHLAGQAARALEIDCIISSPLSRARETAQIIAAEIGYDAGQIQINDLVVERHLGVLEGRPWQENFDMTGVEDVESYADLIVRAEQAYDYLKALPADNILLVSHGAFGRALRHVVNPAVSFYGAGFANGVIVELL